MTGLAVPPAFAERVPEALGPEAVPCLASLPALAERYARKWELEFADAARHGYVGVVQPARRADGSRVVLKLGWVEEESRDEPLALSTWAGRGAVLPHESVPEDGAMLLERLGGSRCPHRPSSRARCPASRSNCSKNCRDRGGNWANRSPAGCWTRRWRCAAGSVRKRESR